MKKAIVVISFGTSYEAQKIESIAPCVEAIRKRFRDWDIYESFSSEMIRKKLRKQQQYNILGPEEIMHFLKEEGYQKVVIQPLFLIEGIEYDKILELASGYKRDMDIKIGRALLAKKQDYKELLGELEEIYMKQDMQILFLGHGTSHEAQASYATLQEALINTRLKAYVMTLEDRAHLHRLPFERGKIMLVPFMLVAGNHILKDVLSEEADSWISGLTSLGYEVQVIQKGLGSYRSTSSIYIRHIEEIMME